MSAGSRQDGFTLIETLVAMTIMLLVAAAVLTAFEAFGQLTSRNAKLTAAEDATRAAVDAMANSLRNAKSVSRSDYDLRFESDRPGFGFVPDGSSHQVRYCLNEPTREVWVQVGGDQSAACGTQGKRIVENVVNRFGDQNRPLFPEPTGGRSAQGGLRVDVWVNPDPERSAQQVHLESAVYVRSLSETAPNVGEGGLRWECDESGGGVLRLETTVDPSGNPLVMRVFDRLPDGSVTLIGAGNEVHVSGGDHPNLTVTITNVLGQEQEIFKPVSCP